MNEHTTIFDIAREAGVSIATVSRVISGSASVRAETRRKVLAVVAKYNFRPSMTGRACPGRRPARWASSFPLIGNPFYSMMCVALQLEAERFNYSTLSLFQIPRGTILQQDFGSADRSPPGQGGLLRRRDRRLLQRLGDGQHAPSCRDGCRWWPSTCARCVRGCPAW